MAVNFVKDPQATLDYAVDWTDWLNGDTLLSSSWDVPEGLAKEADAFTAAGVATVWLSGGDDGTTYRLTNHVVTAGNRTDERTFTIDLRDK